MFILGLVAVVAAISVTPAFAARHLSTDHNLTPGGVKQLNGYRLVLSLAGVLSVMLGLVLVTVGALGDKLRRIADGLVRLLPPRVLKGALLFIVLCFSLLRFARLNADFPSGVTKGAEPYTDEGWYSAAAARHVLTGQWYLAGDVNTAVPAPVIHILQRISFALFGLSLASARTTIIITYLLLTALAALLVRRSFGDYAALLAALLLSTSYVGFAYSRLAVTYLVATFFVVASLFVAGGLDGKGGLPRLLGASLLLGAGILTNGVAVLGVPLLAVLAWRSGTNLKERIVFLAAAGLTLAVLVGGYSAITHLMFPEEYALYGRATVGLMRTNVHDWLVNVIGAIELTRRLGAGLVGLTALFTVYALRFSARFRRDPLVHLLLGYLVTYLVMLSLNSHLPVRYYLPLLVPLAGLCATACTALFDRSRETRWPLAAIIPVILVAGISFGGGRQITAYLARPRYSFYRMAHEVGDIIQKREGNVRGVLLFGDIASSVSLEIGTNAVNSLLGTDKAMQLVRYHPRYMIVHTSDIAAIAASKGGEVIELGAWDVFENYYANGEQVRLFRVDWQPGGPGNPAPAPRLTGGVGL